jgi:hypothetical protein
MLLELATTVMRSGVGITLVKTSSVLLIMISVSFLFDENASIRSSKCVQVAQIVAVPL